MKNKFVTIALLLSITSITFAQVTDAEKQLRTQKVDSIQGWKKGGVIAINGTNTQLYNWAAGGENSVSVNGLLSVFANYKKDKTVWDNALDLGYGKQRQGDNNKPFVKTDDKVDILSKYGRQAYKSFYYAGLLNFKTQMDYGFNYTSDTTKDTISKFLAPAYLIGAIGIDYKPNAYLSVFAAPLTARITIVNDKALSDAGAFGVTPGERNRKEYGGYVRIIYSKNDWKKEILKNVSLTSKIDLFTNYLEDPQNIDVSWENQIAFKINKYITFNFNTHLMYDDNTKNYDSNSDGITDAPKTQYKQITGIGFSYKF